MNNNENKGAAKYKRNERKLIEGGLSMAGVAQWRNHLWRIEMKAVEEVSVAASRLFSS